MNPHVDKYIARNTKWEKEIELLRAIILECPLEEKLKWGSPCYTYDNKNIVLIHVFKDYSAVLFFKGALLNDPEGILIQQTKNVQSARQLRFTNTKEITKKARLLKTYIYEAIEVEKAGLTVKLKTTADYDMPEEFKKRLDKSTTLSAAFDKLTPGRQRAYLFYFSGAKQSTTRTARVEKYIPQILKGKGLED